MTGIQFLAWAREIFLLFITASRPALGHTQPPIQLVLGALCPGVCSVEAKKAWGYTSLCLHGMMLC